MPQKVIGFLSLLDGMHGGIAPSLISESSYARGVNVSSRGGMLHTRPGFVYRAKLSSGTYQGSGRWSLNSGDRLVTVVSGRVLVTRLNEMVTQDLGLLLSASAQCFFAQADRFLWIQDGVTSPVVLREKDDGSAEVVVHSIPAGSIMQFVHGRMHLVPAVVPGTTINGGPYFISSDIALPDEPENVLNFTETEYWNEGGAIGLPHELGFIRGMAAYRNAATGTGVGGLIVLAREGVAAFDMSVERTNWKNINLGQVLFFGAGTDSPWSVASLNNDVGYRSQDGLRFLRYTASMVAGTGGVLSNTPQSNEVATFLDLDTSEDLPFVSSALADNRWLVTTAGNQDRSFRGLISLDFAQVHGFRGADTPSYDGIYVGLKFLQVISARVESTLRALVLHQRGQDVVLSMLDPAAVSDDSGSGTTPIRSRVVTRVYDFGGVDLKRLEYAELWASDVRVPTTVTIRWRPAGYPLWVTAGTRSLDVPSGSLPQVRRKVRIPFPSGSSFCNPATGESLLVGQDLQFCIEFTGYLQIDKFLVAADVSTDTQPAPCSVAVRELSAGAMSGEALSDFDYVVKE